MHHELKRQYLERFFTPEELETLLKRDFASPEDVLNFFRSHRAAEQSFTDVFHLEELEALWATGEPPEDDVFGPAAEEYTSDEEFPRAPKPTVVCFADTRPRFNAERGALYNAHEITLACLTCIFLSLKQSYAD